MEDYIIRDSELLENRPIPIDPILMNHSVMISSGISVNWS